MPFDKRLGPQLNLYAKAGQGQTAVELLCGCPVCQWA